MDSDQSPSAGRTQKPSQSKSKPVRWRLDKVPAKIWGSSYFKGLGFDLDPMWMLTEPEREIVNSVMELCRLYFRPLSAKVREKLRRPLETKLIHWSSLLFIGIRQKSNQSCARCVQSLGSHDPLCPFVWSLCWNFLKWRTESLCHETHDSHK